MTELNQAEKKDILPPYELKKCTDALEMLHDTFENRGILTNPEIAKAMADRFTTAGLEVLADLIHKLQEVKK